MPADEQKTQESAGISADADPDRPVDVGALLERLREEVRRSGADPGAGSGPSDRRALRDEAERLWPVSADRSLRLRPGVRGGLATPLKAVLRVLTQAFLWRLLDLDESDGRTIDMVVATKFPSYVVRHPEKRVWLIHQFRQAYDLDRTDLGQFDESPEDRALRRSVQRLDRVALGEASRLFATSRNVADRLERSTGLVAEVLPHPPQELAFRCDGYGDFVLSASRLDRAKRIDLLLEAVALDPSLRAVVVSDGPDRGRLEAIARDHHLDGRVEFRGRVSADELA